MSSLTVEMWTLSPHFPATWLMNGWMAVGGWWQRCDDGRSKIIWGFCQQFFSRPVFIHVVTVTRATSNKKKKLPTRWRSLKSVQFLIFRTSIFCVIVFHAAAACSMCDPPIVDWHRSDDDDDIDDDDDDDILIGGRRHGDDDNASYESTHTLTNEASNNKNRKLSHANNKHGRTADTSNEGDSTEAPTSSASSPFSRDGSGGGDADDANACDGGISSAISSASISLPATPIDTPLPARRNASSSQRPHRKHVKNANDTTATTSANGKNVGNHRSSKKKKRNRLVEVRESTEEHEPDTDSSVSHVRVGKRGSRRHAAMRQLSVSNATLTNVSHNLFVFYFVLSSWLLLPVTI